jgi:transketolase
MRTAFVAALLEQARHDPAIMLLTGDLGYGVLNNFQNELPNQYLNFGINEQSLMSAAAGMARSGLKPYVYSIGNFPTLRCLEQIRNDVCYMNLNVTIVALGVGFAYGSAGYSHHLIEDLGSVSSLPNISIFTPADSRETSYWTRRFQSLSGPKYLRLGKGGELDLDASLTCDTRGFSIKKGSSKVAIISTGSILGEVIDASELLKAVDIDPTIINICELNNVNIESLLGIIDGLKIFIVEEHVIRGGLGSWIQELAQKSTSTAVTLGISLMNADRSGDQSHLRKVYGLDSEAIFKTISKSLKSP